MQVNQLTVVIVLCSLLLGAQLPNLNERLSGSYQESAEVVVSAYCRAPERLQSSLRQLLDQTASPHKIRVECAHEKRP